MTCRRSVVALLAVLVAAGSAWADAPVASYLFPAGGQRGTAVRLRVGGLNLHKGCGFEMLGPGVTASKRLERTETLWFEGPLLSLPDSQRQEDYPKDYAGEVRLAVDAPLGLRHARLWTSQGATPALKFVVGDLPEVIEDEIDGDPVPVAVAVPVTINGRIFPRQDVDVWTVPLKKGQALTCVADAARLGSPLDARLEVRDAQGRQLAEGATTSGGDPSLRFTAPADGTYQVRIHDTAFRGGQAYVYRLTLTCDPYVDRAYPLGGRRGTTVAFDLTGQGLPSAAVPIALPRDGADVLHRLTVGGKQTNEFLLDLDDLPEHREAEPNDRPEQVKPVTVPAVLNGRIEKPGDVDCWAVHVRKGDVYEIELRAAQLGSPLDGTVAVLDAAGKEVARADTPAAGRVDPSLRFTAAADGTYTVRVQDRFRSRGGPAFAYRLRVGAPAAPDFRLRLPADALTVSRGGSVNLSVQAERLGGFADPIALTFDGLPEGVTVKGATLAAKQNAVNVAFQAGPKTPIGAGRVTVRGSATVGGSVVTRTAVLPAPRGVRELDSVLVAVALPTPFKIVGEYDMRWAARGTMHQRRYKVERKDYDGPIEISLADRQARHLQGVTGGAVLVPMGATEFTYPVQLPPWMETGRTCRVCVMGAAVVKDFDGTEHVVTYSSTNQNEQLVAVVETGRLGVEVGRTSVSARPGEVVSVPVRVLRGKGLTGAARVELVVPRHVRGVSAEAVTVAAGKDAGELRIRFAAAAVGPFNMPLTVRAVVAENGRPVTGEATVEIVAGP